MSVCRSCWHSPAVRAEGFASIYDHFTFDVVTELFVRCPRLFLLRVLTSSIIIAFLLRGILIWVILCTTYTDYSTSASINFTTVKLSWCRCATSIAHIFLNLLNSLVHSAVHLLRVNVAFNLIVDCVLSLTTWFTFSSPSIIHIVIIYQCTRIAWELACFVKGVQLSWL